MTVEEIFAGGKLFMVTGSGYAPHGEFSLDGKSIDPGADIALSECLTAGLLCNDSNLISSSGEWKIEGDPTEGALITSALKSGQTRERATEKYPRIDAIPFESQYQYMATLHTEDGTQKKIIYQKGSAESVLSRCDKALMSNGKTGPLDLEQCLYMVSQLTRKGLRVR
jgi:cation-transporting P-type ATPase F